MLFQQSGQKLWGCATMVPHPAQRGGSAKSSIARPTAVNLSHSIRFLSLGACQRTRAAVPPLFDMHLRALRRDRAARQGPELFLYERVFDDCLERIALAQRRFEDALLIGCPDASWPVQLGSLAERVEACDPGPLFAERAGGAVVIEDHWEPPLRRFDLVLALGTLDTVNDLPLALKLLRHAMRPRGLLIGAMAGGNTLPQLRSAMRAADAITGSAAPHVHPRIDAAAVAPLLESAGFRAPVIDVERVPVSYASFDRLIIDLRRMAATNILLSRPAFVGRRAYAAAREAFHNGDEAGRTVERFEIVHLAAWSAEER